MRVLATDEEKKIIRQYMKNADDYLDKELTPDEYSDFEDYLDEIILSLFDKNQDPTYESNKLERIYDNIYYRVNKEYIEE